MRLPTALLATAVLLSAFPRPGDAAPAPVDASMKSEPAAAAIRVEHDVENFTTTVGIPAPDGRVAWADVARGLTCARGYDDAALEEILPTGSIDLSKRRWRLVLVGLNVALRSNVQFDVQPVAPDGDDWRLVIKLDQAALSASRRRFKTRLQGALMRPLRRDKQQYGLKLDEDWDRAAADRNLVVLIHGLNSTPAKVGGLLAGARDDGFACAEFSYPNDQTIDDSAKLLGDELSRFAEDHPGRKISLVTHSMGALVARAAIEDPKRDPGNVRQLVMVAPPNHGSALARFSFGLELHEHLAGGRKAEVGTFLAAIEDGLAGAARDLRPDSPFLRTLNARARNPNVRYTIFLGTRAPLTEADLARLRRAVAAAGQRNRWAQFFGPRMDAWLADLDETIVGKGDGVVSLTRGRLDGVEDTLVLNFSHTSVLRVTTAGDERKVHREILRRLKAK